MVEFVGAKPLLSFKCWADCSRLEFVAACCLTTSRDLRNIHSLCFFASDFRLHFVVVYGITLAIQNEK